MWSDPEDAVEAWSHSPRGAGWLFGARVTEDFMEINKLDLICRAHQLVHEGIKYMFDRKLVTVWSAPNYCYRCGNVASILDFKSSKERIPIIFKAVPDSERIIPAQQITPYFYKQFCTNTHLKVCVCVCFIFSMFNLIKLHSCDR